MRNGVYLQAHKGVESEYPENTMPAFCAAAEQGYEMIELDLGVTKDHQIIVMHDEKINRTARREDGSELAEPVCISDLTYAEALTYDFGLWFSPAFRGTRLPLFSQVLALAAEHDILLKLDNKIQRFAPEDLDRLFAMLKASPARICISCWNEEIARRTIRELPRGEISFDGLTDEAELARLCALAGREKLTIWIPVDRDRASWAPVAWFASPETCRMIQTYARLGLWAIRDVDSFDRAAVLYRPYAAETNGTIKPDKR